jgi:hypothetical protein
MIISKLLKALRQIVIMRTLLSRYCFQSSTTPFFQRHAHPTTPLGRLQAGSRTLSLQWSRAFSVSPASVEARTLTHSLAQPFPPPSPLPTHTCTQNSPHQNFFSCTDLSSPLTHLISLCLKAIFSVFYPKFNCPTLVHLPYHPPLPSHPLLQYFILLPFSLNVNKNLSTR